MQNGCESNFVTISLEGSVVYPEPIKPIKPIEPIEPIKPRPPEGSAEADGGNKSRSGGWRGWFEQGSDRNKVGSGEMTKEAYEKKWETDYRSIDSHGQNDFNKGREGNGNSGDGGNGNSEGGGKSGEGGSGGGRGGTV